MSDISQGEGWWQASDGKWYPPELYPKDWNAPAADTAATSADAVVGQAGDTASDMSSDLGAAAGLSTPDVSVPDLPSMDTPSGPDLPDVSTPDVSVPDLPDVSTPDLPDLSAPDLPDVSTPDVPSMSAPSVPDLPDASVPDLPSVDVPNVDVPNVDVPNVDGPDWGTPDPTLATPSIGKPAVPTLPDPAADLPTTVSGVVTPPPDPTMVQPVTPAEPAAWGSPSSPPPVSPPPVSPPPMSAPAVSAPPMQPPPVSAPQADGGLSWGASAAPAAPGVRAAAVDEQSNDVFGGGLSLLGGLMMIIGSFLAWATAIGPLSGDINGLGGSNGWGTLICGLLVVVGGGMLAVGQSKSAAAALITLAAIIGLGLAIFSFFDIGSLSDELPQQLRDANLPDSKDGVEAALDKGIGIWIALAGSVLALLAGIAGLVRATKD